MNGTLTRTRLGREEWLAASIRRAYARQQHAAHVELRRYVRTHGVRDEAGFWATRRTCLRWEFAHRDPAWWLDGATELLEEPEQIESLFPAEECGVESLCAEEAFAEGWEVSCG